MVKEVSDQKKLLREQNINARKAMLYTEKHNADLEIAKKVFELSCYKKSDTVLIYVSKDIEVDTMTIIDHALKNGKKVAVPKCTDTKNIDFYLIKSYDDLIKGFFDIMEPDINKCQKITDFSKSICLVPALSFDLNGYRLGYGGGYYDRFLKNFSEISVGLCYDINIVPVLPTDNHDQKVDFIVTENNLLTF